MAKRARTGPAQPEDLFRGAVVLYGEGGRGVVHEAFAPLDQFWVVDEQSNELIRDEDGNPVPFSSSELQPAPPPERRPGDQGTGSARVLLIGTEQQMLQLLEQFGAPDASERREPQQLLAVPCASLRCGPSCARYDPCKRVMCSKDCPLLQLAAEGVDEAMLALAQRLRPDIHVGVRAFHLKQAMEQIGPDLNRLEGYYCLSAVSLPYGRAEVAAASGWERYWMEDVRCQIDLGVSAVGPHEEGEAGLEDTARRALGEACGVCLSDAIWSEDAQFRLRKELGVDLPLKFWDGPETKVFLVLLPKETVASSAKGLLSLSEANAPSGPPRSAEASAAGGEKTIAQWKEDQEQFKDLPKLPAGWIRVKSRKSEQVYYWDTKSNKASYELPLPDGWTKQVSKTTGKVYYFNARKRKSTFDVPTE